jgi:hypothetical protein
MGTSLVVDAGDGAGVAAAVASVAGLVDQLSEVVTPPLSPHQASDADEADPLKDLAERCLSGLGCWRGLRLLWRR